ncbi:MAG: hypothetical protein HFH26_14305 [Clostridiaceae bacterium]|nr:hypothetical protein [Clostridiaceae bacterium]
MPDEKVRFQMRISPGTDQKVTAAMKLTNSQSKNEFVENALIFYCSYLSAKNSDDFLPPALVSAMRGTVQDSENRIARLLFKMTVELSMMMNVLAVGLEINADDLDRLRGQCVRDVRKSNGSITFKDTVTFQNGR